MLNKTGNSLSSRFFLVLVLVLAAAAIVAAYFMYFRQPPAEDPLETEAVIQRGALSKESPPEVAYQFTPEERKALDMSRVMSESPGAPKMPGDIQSGGAATPEPPSTVEQAEGAASLPAASAAAPEVPAADEPAVSTPSQAEPAAVAPAAQQTAEAFKPAPVKSETWVINALSTQDGEKARAIMDEMMKLPYRVYAYQKEIKGRNWYRIRVGFFSSREEAEKAGLKIAETFKLPPPWIVKPGRSELEKYHR